MNLYVKMDILVLYANLALILEQLPIARKEINVRYVKKNHLLFSKFS